MDYYLYGLATKMIVAKDIYKPELKATVKLGMYSIIDSIEKFKIGRENVYHIKTGEALKLATKEYKLTLVSNNKEEKAHGRYIKQTTGKKRIGKDATLIVEFLKAHKFKDVYTASLKELRHALNLDEFEGSKRVTLSRITDRIKRNMKKIHEEIFFSMEVHKKDEKITFYFDKQKPLF